MKPVIYQPVIDFGSDLPKHPTALRKAAHEIALAMIKIARGETVCEHAQFRLFVDVTGLMQ